MLPASYLPPTIGPTCSTRSTSGLSGCSRDGRLHGSVASRYGRRTSTRGPPVAACAGCRVEAAVGRGCDRLAADRIDEESFMFLGNVRRDPAAATRIRRATGFGPFARTGRIGIEAKPKTPLQGDEVNASKENRSGPVPSRHGGGARRPSTGSRVNGVREPGETQQGRMGRGKRLPSGSKS